MEKAPAELYAHERLDQGAFEFADEAGVRSRRLREQEQIRAMATSMLEKGGEIDDFDNFGEDNMPPIAYGVRIDETWKNEDAAYNQYDVDVQQPDAEPDSSTVTGGEGDRTATATGSSARSKSGRHNAYSYTEFGYGRNSLASPAAF